MSPIKRETPFSRWNRGGVSSSWSCWPCSTQNIWSNQWAANLRFRPEEKGLCGPFRDGCWTVPSTYPLKELCGRGENIKEEFATLTRNGPKFNYNPSLLEGYTACRLIPLDKNLGVGPIRVGEVSRRIIGNVQGGDKGGSWPTARLCRSQGRIRSSQTQLFNEEVADWVLLIDASNPFNQMHKAVAAHNIRIICKEIALYIINTYRSPSRLFISGGGDILSQEGMQLTLITWSVVSGHQFYKSNKSGWRMIPRVERV